MYTFSKSLAFFLSLAIYSVPRKLIYKNMIADHKAIKIASFIYLVGVSLLAKGIDHLINILHNSLV